MQQLRYPPRVRTIEEIRLANYQRLIQELEAAKGASMNGPEIAAALGLSTVYVWQLANKKRESIESKAARKIEEAADKPRGWMDCDAELWPFKGIDIAAIHELTSEQRIELQGVIRRMVNDFHMGTNPMDPRPQKVVTFSPEQAETYMRTQRRGPTSTHSPARAHGKPGGDR